MIGGGGTRRPSPRRRRPSTTGWPSCREHQTDQRSYTRFQSSATGPSGESPRKSTLVLDLTTARALPGILAGFTSRQQEVLKVELHKRLGFPWSTLLSGGGGDVAAPALVRHQGGGGKPGAAGDRPYAGATTTAGCTPFLVFYHTSPCRDCSSTRQIPSSPSPSRSARTNIQKLWRLARDSQ